VSAADIIAAWQKEPEGTPPVVSRDFFRDKLVLIGLTAPLVKDYQKTSIAKSVPGLWLHAAATQNLLEGTHFRVLPSWAGWGLMALLALAPALPRLERPRAMAAAGLGLTAIYLASAGGALAGSLLMLPLIGPLLACALSCSLLAASYWGHERNRRQCMEAMEFAKQQFTDMLVHDLKNTVAPIMMSLSMRDLAGPDGEPAPSDGEFWRTDFPEIVWTSSNKLMSQINALLDIRRMQEGKLELHPTPCRPAELLDRLEHEYHIPAKRSDLSLAMRNEAPVGACVCVDPNVFDRIMGNLIWNAVKYAREQSTVRIGVRPASPGRLEFYVSNEGRAIDPEIKALLFTAFSTGSDSVASIAMPSTGLGLAFCKLAVEAHGGHIELLSPRVDEPDGVEVRVRLKLVSEEEAAGEGGGAR
jgi:signal transduction histidine kinase